MAAVLALTVSKAEPLRRGQDHLWRCVRTLGAEGKLFTSGDLAAVSAETTRANVTTFLRRLEGAGWIEARGKRAGPGRSPATLWALIREQEATPRLGKDGEDRGVSGQQAMWNVVRGPMGRGGFDVRDLVAWGSVEGATIAPMTARSFVQALKRGGYLQLLDPGKGSRPARWRLRPAMNTGPKPPMCFRAKLIFDANLGRVVGETTAEEDRA